MSKEEIKDSRFDDLETEEYHPPVDMRGIPNKYMENYVSSSDEEFPDEFEKYAISSSDDDIMTKETTSRLAITGLYWEKVKASDIFAFIKYSLNEEDRLNSVIVYVSHYGEEHLEELNKDDIPEDQPDDVRAAAFRKRQHVLSKCYFAIAEFADVDAADHAYTTLSRCEISDLDAGSTGNFLDLSVVPDEQDFKDFKIRDSAKEVTENWTLPNMKASWVTSTKAEDDWDTNPERESIVNSIWEDDLDDETQNELAKALIGSGSEDDERPTRDSLAATLKALAEEEEEDNAEEELSDMVWEFTSKAGPEKKKKEKVTEEEDVAEEKTERKRKKKEEKQKKKKEKMQYDDAELVDSIMNDDRFKEVVEQPGYGIDATDSNFKKDAAMDMLRNKIARQHQKLLDGKHK